MASNGPKQKLHSGVLNLIPQTYNTNSKTYPLVAALTPLGFTRNGSIIHPDSISGKPLITTRKLVMFFAIYLAGGTLSFYLVHNDIKGKKTDPIIDALYLSVVTMTTVGYGDLVPNTTFVKVLSCVFVFVGICLVGLILTKVADYLLEKHEMLLVNVLTKPQNNVPLFKKGSKRKKYKWLLAMVILLGLMLVGTMFLHSFENMDVVDAIYCVITTISTLGYGDKSFSTKGGRLFGAVWILSGTLGLGQFFVYVAEILTETRRRTLANLVLTWGITNFDLEAAHTIDSDGITEVGEFVVNKLKEMGKISQYDISSLMKEFEDIDVHKCGVLPASHLSLTPTTEPKK